MFTDFDRAFSLINTNWSLIRHSGKHIDVISKFWEIASYVFKLVESFQCKESHATELAHLSWLLSLSVAALRFLTELTHSCANCSAVPMVTVGSVGGAALVGGAAFASSVEAFLQ